MQTVEYAMAACDMMMRSFKPEELPPCGRFYYHQGVFLLGMAKVYELTGRQDYLAYIRSYVDAVMDEQGCTKEPPHNELDDVMAGMLLYFLLDQTGEERYRKGIDYLHDVLMHMPRTSEGAPWHKAHLKSQMWLDGLFMSGPFSMAYASRFDCPELREWALNHVRVMFRHTRDPQTGLMYHAWDESGEAVWAQPGNGHSAEFWGRAMGWIAYGLLYDMDFVQPGTPVYEELAQYDQMLLQAVLKYQSPDGRWYQVVDRADDPANWLENSCSCLFTAALYKGMRMGVMPSSCTEAAERGYEGIIRSLAWKGEDIQIGHVCVGTDVGDYQHYLNRPTSVNDLHGVGAFLILCAERLRYQQNQ